ncbi:carbohydrate binding-domain-containing protein [Mycena epipterygia]|nr:carbohydrate binding-domain-containing protein [Mycena epipterygia]
MYIKGVQFRITQRFLDVSGFNVVFYSYMARLISIILAALVSGVVALESCGIANYDPSQYTCFNNTLLCPIVNGVAYQACGEDCYSTSDPTSQYTCFNNSLLCPIVNNIAYQACGEDCYSPSEYTCFNGNFLCAFTSEGIETQRCGDTCYSPLAYSCNPDNSLSPVPCH